MSGSASAPTTCTFILRLRLEWAGEGLTWRGWIEHLPSGTRAAVQDWAAVAAFMRGFGVGADSVRLEIGGKEEVSDGSEDAASEI